MSRDNLSFLDDGQSVASTVSQLHHYFKNMHSRYKVKQSELMNHAHAGSQEAETIKEELQRLEEVKALSGILTDSLSVANRVLHSTAIAEILGVDSDVYTIHLEDEDEQNAEREAAQRKIASAKKTTV